MSALPDPRDPVDAGPTNEQWFPTLRECIAEWMLVQGRDYHEVLQLAQLASREHCTPPPDPAEVRRFAGTTVAALSMAMIRQLGRRAP